MTDRCTACGLDVYDGGELCRICRDDPPPGYTESGQNGRVELSTHKTPTPLQQAALNAISEYGGVVAAAHALGCNHGVISLAKTGHDFPKARKMLGLPPKTVEVPPCEDCGKVHETKATCTDKLEQARKTDDYVVAFHMRDPDVAAALRARFDAHGSRRDVGQRLASGELMIAKRGEK